MSAPSPAAVHQTRQRSVDRLRSHGADRVVTPRLLAQPQGERHVGEHRRVDPVVGVVDAHDHRGVGVDRAAQVVVHRAGAAARVEPEGGEQGVQPTRARPARAAGSVARRRSAGTHSASALGNGAGDPPARWMRLTRLSNGTARHHARYTVSSPARSGAGRSASPSRSSTASVNAGSSATARSVRRAALSDIRVPNAAPGHTFATPMAIFAVGAAWKPDRSVK